MKNLLPIICLLGLLFTTSCKKETDPIEEEPYIFGFSDYNEARAALGAYADYFVLCDGALNHRSTQHISGWGTSVQNSISARYLSDLINLTRANGGTYYFNDDFLSYDQVANNGRYVENRDYNDIVSASWGKLNRYRLERDGDTICDTTFYVPRMMDLASSFTATALPQTSYYDFSRNQMQITWNADPQNELGVVIMMHYDGSVFNPATNSPGGSSASPKDIAIKVPDNGQFTLPAAFFDGLPPKALCSMWVIRGNVVIAPGNDDKNYNFAGITESMFSAVLRD
jgi:hypothetical protein